MSNSGFIEFDLKNVDDVSFSGIKSVRSVFINDYYHRVMSRNNALNSSVDSAYSIWIRNYKSDSLLLLKYQNEYSLDSTFIIFYKQVLEYEFLNNMTTFNSDFSKYYKDAAKYFNLNNDILKYYVMYYSAIQGYMIYYNNFKFNPKKIEDIKAGFEYADKILVCPYNNIFKAYLIGYFYLGPFRNKLKNGKEIKDLINNYIVNCKDDIIKEELLQMLKDRKIEI